MLNYTANNTTLANHASNTTTAHYNGGAQLGSFLLVSLMAAFGGLAM
jgi:hypothetical protein